MHTCPACNAEFAEPSYSGLCAACDDPEPIASKPMLALVGLGLAVIPFFASIQNKSTVSFTAGDVTTTKVSGMDYIAVGAGGLGALLGVMALIIYGKEKNKLGLGLGVAALALGGYQVARGLFWI